METIVNKIAGKPRNKVSYQHVSNQDHFEDIEEGKNQGLLDEIERYRSQDKFNSVNLNDDEEDKEETNSDDQPYNEINPTNDINITSSAWPKHENVELQSKVHKLIRQEIKHIDKSKIVFRQLKGPDIEEIRKLHNEWFPIKYSDEYFRRIYKSNCISIGAFYPITQEEPAGKRSKRKSRYKTKYVILGATLTSIKRDNEDINEIYRRKRNPRGLIARLQEMVTCRQYYGAYIMTIGVIDECRRDGLGTKMLNYTEDIIFQMFPACEVLYLHVIDYNDAAIKFYQRNNFQTLKTVKNHYNLKGLDYDAVIMYKDLEPRIRERAKEVTKVPQEIQQWSYYDYAWFPYEYVKEYYNRM